MSVFDQYRRPTQRGYEFQVDVHPSGTNMAGDAAAVVMNALPTRDSPAAADESDFIESHNNALWATVNDWIASSDVLPMCLLKLIHSFIALLVLETPCCISIVDNESEPSRTRASVVKSVLRHFERQGCGNHVVMFESSTTPSSLYGTMLPELFRYTVTPREKDIENVVEAMERISKRQLLLASSNKPSWLQRGGIFLVFDGCAESGLFAHARMRQFLSLVGRHLPNVCIVYADSTVGVCPSNSSFENTSKYVFSRTAADTDATWLLSCGGDGANMSYIAIVSNCSRAMCPTQWQYSLSNFLVF